MRAERSLSRAPVPPLAVSKVGRAAVVIFQDQKKSKKSEISTILNEKKFHKSKNDLLTNKIYRSFFPCLYEIGAQMSKLTIQPWILEIVTSTDVYEVKTRFCIFVAKAK